MKLEDFKDTDLPKEMQKMNKDERKAYVEKNAKERQEIQKKIQTLNESRKKHIAAEMKKLAGADKSLGSAMIKAVRKQAETRNFKFEQTN
jgi:molybdopterin-biosynthesis enzyme MoeA-like protein